MIRSASPDTRMRDRIITTLLLCAMGAAFASPALSLSHQHPAKCHEGMQAPSSPKSNDHECCSIGHDRALPQEIVRLRHSPACIPVAVSKLVSDDRIVVLLPTNLFVDSASPPSSSPLRV